MLIIAISSFQACSFLMIFLTNFLKRFELQVFLRVSSEFGVAKMGAISFGGAEVFARAASGVGGEIEVLLRVEFDEGDVKRLN